MSVNSTYQSAANLSTFTPEEIKRIGGLKLAKTTAIVLGVACIIFSFYLQAQCLIHNPVITWKHNLYIMGMLGAGIGFGFLHILADYWIQKIQNG